MKKSFLVLLIALSFVMGISSIVLAQSYVTQTTMPMATGVTVTASRIDSKGTETPADDTWAANPGLNLDMGSLIKNEGTALITGPDGITRNLTWVVYLPQFYFALDVGLNGGIDTSRFVHLAFSNPTLDEVAITDPTIGLGKRGNMFYSKTYLPTPADWIINHTVDSPVASIGLDGNGSHKRRFDDPQSVPMSDVVGGWLRLYFGTANGNPTPGFGVDKDAFDSLLFSPSDPTGVYKATITLTYGA